MFSLKLILSSVGFCLFFFSFSLVLLIKKLFIKKACNAWYFSHIAPQMYLFTWYCNHYAVAELLSSSKMVM